MLMSLSEKFVFLGNRKAASTSLQDFLTKRCEVISSTSWKFGPHPVTGNPTKHMTYEEWTQIFAAFFRKFSLVPDNFLVFGVIRDPAERVRSFYSFISDIPDTNMKRKYGELTLDQFVELYLTDGFMYNYRKLSQVEFFGQSNFLIRMEQASEDLDALYEETGYDFRGAMQKARNPSRPRELSLSPELKKALADALKPEYDLYEKAGRMLTPIEPSDAVDISAAIKFMALKTNQYDMAATLFSRAKDSIWTGTSTVDKLFGHPAIIP
ncbi:sulfotransferase family 2 domain-containing protein [Aquisalinus flavus]|uniref:Sulfotransferase n=1 Tax=Aquisalinus flavus TaxID=1526572 RepID=A0A8J2V4S8_9PROT|nr:sulfotransferase family 2 domain-containing protein [Aquisalinus flavus]MBD0427795.1 sulfotransferase family 2 domain-containing protein [Aquisalinus flavus]UNE47568.1 sulfotransferase family protein [Aquisalinus flavus]GGD03882.1 hypothetical protein GCM10011342_11100 [Aquisalinus flavus]